MSDEQTYDYIVVGAGSAGCTVANRLVTRTDARVLLIEAGGPDTAPAIHDEKMSSIMSLWGPGPADWGYATVAQDGAGGREMPVARAKVWGGCSSINALMHVRGHRLDFDRWAAMGNRGWSYDDVLPLFKDSENFDGVESEWRGVDGPLSVRMHDKPSPASLRLFDAGKEAGMIDRGPDFDYNAEFQTDSVFLYQAAKTRDNHRASTAVAYLTPMLDAPNLTVLSNTQVTRLVIENGRATGVEVVTDGVPDTIRSAGEIILSCGAYESPKLLMLSGVGPAETLGTFGIPTISNLAGVGQNLQDHLVVGVCYLSKQENPFELTMIAETGFFRRSSHVGPDETPDVQMLMGALKFVTPEYDQEGPGYTFAPAIVQPRSVGYVTLRSGDPTDTAILQPNYLTDPADIDSFVDAIAFSRELAHTSAYADFILREIAPGPDVTDRSAIEDYVRRNASTLWHPVGTCSLGSVVDSELRVLGVDGLRVADASVMPKIVSGNTNAATIMIGEKMAQLLGAGAPATFAAVGQGA